MLIALLYDEVFMHADMDVGRLVRSRLKKRVNTSSISTCSVEPCLESWTFFAYVCNAREW